MFLQQIVFFNGFVVYCNLSFCLLVFFLSYQKKFFSFAISSPLIAVVSQVLGDLTGFFYRKVILSEIFFEHVVLVRHIWYLGYALFSLLTIVLIIKLHSYYQITLHKLAKTIIFSQACLASLQMIEYIPRAFFNLSKQEIEQLPIIPYLYSYGISSINVSVSFFIALVVGYSLILKLRASKVF